MKKPARNLVVVATAVLVVLGYLGFQHMRTPRRVSFPLTSEARLQEKTARVAHWLAQPAVPLLSPELGEAVGAIVAKEGCIEPPAIATPVSLATLRDSQKRDLRLAVEGLLQAYGKNDPSAAFDYMVGRKERLCRDVRTWIKDDLVNKYGMNRRDFDGMSDRKLFELIWTRGACRTHWQNLIANSGCVTVWKTEQPLDQRLAFGMGADENAVFKNMVSHRHDFESVSTSIPSTLAKDGAVTFADVKVVIQYDNARHNEPRPHYFRFWFDTTNQIWHLQDVVLIPTVDGTYPKIWF